VAEGRREGAFDLFAAHRAVLAAQALDAGDQLLLFALLVYANKRGECWPSLRRLTKDVRLGLTTIQRHKAKLVALGVLQQEHRLRGSARGRVSAASNLYRINLAALQALSHLTEEQARRLDGDLAPDEDPTVGPEPSRPRVRAGP
jgi:hypothetical protein